MKIAIATPSSAVQHSGNRITAQRYARLFRGLGHRLVKDALKADLLVALHARKSAGEVLRYRRLRPEGKIILVLTGTDLHPVLDPSRAARKALALADALVVLEPQARQRLPEALRAKCAVVRQSLEGPLPRRRILPGRIVQLGHLRRAKDPLRAALALRGLEGFKLVHCGGEHEPGWATRARAQMRRNPAYHWKGEQSPARARAELSRAMLFVLPSRVEGSSSALIEALVMGVPVLASRAAGNVGTLGADHPGLFDVGDTRALRAMFLRASQDAAWLARLERASRRLARLHQPRIEREAWHRLLQRVSRSQPDRLTPPE